MRALHRVAFAALAVLLPGPALALSVEALAGHERSSVDLMFFRFFPAGAEDRSDFLLFQRARGSFGYTPADPADAAQLGITTAVSWNPAALRGVAPVLVGQVLTAGPVAKAGVQYARPTERFTVFGWAVAELAPTPTIDVFALARLRVPVGERLAVGGAVEALVTVPTDPDDPLSLVERARVGVGRGGWQVGPGLDLAQYRADGWTLTWNLGGFVRHDFGASAR